MNEKEKEKEFIFVMAHEIWLKSQQVKVILASPVAKNPSHLTS